MKKTSFLLAATFLSFGILASHAQFGGSGRSAGGPSFSGATGKLFGDNQIFTATLEFQTADPTSHKEMTMPGKISFDGGKSRFEMNMADVKGGSIPPNVIPQMKEMGLDMMVSITRPDKKASYLIYPGMHSYVEAPMNTGDEAGADDFKMTTTQVGKETIDGHDCVKNQVTVTSKDGTKQESTVWNATDLNQFPVKIESTEQGRTFDMTFKEISLKAPAAGTFEVPASFTKYSSPQEMMQAVIMKKMGSMGGRPPGQ